MLEIGICSSFINSGTSESKPQAISVRNTVRYLNRALNIIVDIAVRRGDVLSCWTGLRPLVMDPNKADTQSLARNHIIEVGKNHLITIAGQWFQIIHSDGMNFFQFFKCLPQHSSLINCGSCGMLLLSIFRGENSKR